MWPWDRPWGGARESLVTLEVLLYDSVSCSQYVRSSCHYNLKLAAIMVWNHLEVFCWYVEAPCVIRHHPKVVLGGLPR